MTTDVVEAQKIMREKLADVTHVLFSGRCNIRWPWPACSRRRLRRSVSISIRAVERAVEHQPFQSIGLVTDVEPFLRELAECIARAKRMPAIAKN